MSSQANVGLEQEALARLGRGDLAGAADLVETIARNMTDPVEQEVWLGISSFLQMAQESRPQT